MQNYPIGKDLIDFVAIHLKIDQNAILYATEVVHVPPQEPKP